MKIPNFVDTKYTHKNCKDTCAYESANFCLCVPFAVVLKYDLSAYSLHCPNHCCRKRACRPMAICEKKQSNVMVGSAKINDEKTYDQLVKDFDMKIQKLVKDLDESHNYLEKKLQDLTSWVATLETTADATVLFGMLEKTAEKTAEKMTDKITEKRISFVTDAVMMKVDMKKDVVYF